MNLPICVSLHFCGTATVPPIWKTFRARSVATVNTADFSAGPEIKLERTLWEDNAEGPKIEAQISSILPRTSIRSPGESTSVYSRCKAHSSTCSYKLGGGRKNIRFSSRQIWWTAETDFRQNASTVQTMSRHLRSLAVHPPLNRSLICSNSLNWQSFPRKHAHTFPPVSRSSALHSHFLLCPFTSL